MMFLDCLAYLDQDGTARCGLPAEVRCRFTMRSTDGPIESTMITCPAGHWFNGPIEFLNGKAERSTNRAMPELPLAAGVTAAWAVTMALDGSGGSVARDSPGEPGRALSRPNDAPAYYLRRPARVWITAMSPRRRRTARTPGLARPAQPRYLWVI